jgi:hypothetical protein
LRCSVGNSKSQLHKAKARMRKLLGFSVAQKSLSTSDSATATTASRHRQPVLSHQTVALEVCTPGPDMAGSPGLSSAA